MEAQADMPTASEFQKRGLDVDTNYVDLIPLIMIFTRVVFSSSRPFESSGHLNSRTPWSLHKTSHVMHPLYSFTMQTNNQLVRLNELRAQLAAVKMVGTRGSEAQQQLGTPRQAKLEAAARIVEPVDEAGDEEADVEIISNPDSHLELLDPNTEQWLRNIGLWEFANLPWKVWEATEYAEAYLWIVQSEVGLWHPKCR